MVAARYVKIVELEEEMSEFLAGPIEQQVPSQFIKTYVAWQRLCLTKALEEGEVSVGESDLRDGLELALNPVILGGIHRSGTTLLQNLLDDHHQILVLPGETNFFNGFLESLCEKNHSQKLAFMVEKWLILLVKPSSHEPFWLLGKSSSDNSPYVRFIRYLMFWLRIAITSEKINRNVGPLVAWMLAVWCQNYGNVKKNKYRYWLEKTPENENKAKIIASYFPDAKFIFMLRNSIDVFSSYKKMEIDLYGNFIDRYIFINALIRSHNAISRCYFLNKKNHLIVKYEDLVSNRDDVMSKVCHFLSVENEISWNQTVFGYFTLPNTSFREGRGENITSFEAELIGYMMRRTNSIFNYSGPRIFIWTKLVMYPYFYCCLLGSWVYAKLYKFFWRLKNLAKQDSF